MSLFCFLYNSVKCDSAHCCWMCHKRILGSIEKRRRLFIQRPNDEENSVMAMETTLLSHWWRRYDEKRRRNLCHKKILLPQVPRRRVKTSQKRKRSRENLAFHWIINFTCVSFSPFSLSSQCLCIFKFLKLSYDIKRSEWMSFSWMAMALRLVAKMERGVDLY